MPRVNCRRRTRCGTCVQITANAVQSVLVDVWPGERQQCRDQVPDQGQQQPVRLQLSRRKSRHVSGGRSRNVPVCSVSRRHHYSAHQHAHCNDESLLRGHSGLTTRHRTTVVLNNQRLV